MIANVLLVIFALIIGVYLLQRLRPTLVVNALIALLARVLGFKRREIRVAGHSWPYFETGNPEKPVILLVHGYAADKSMWLSYARLLGNYYRVIMPDLPGFGQAEKSLSQDYSPRLQAVRLAAFCRELGLRDLHVTGSSMGGYISAWLAIEAPDIVRSLTLMNAAGVFGADASPVQTDAEAGRNPLVADSMQDLQRLLPLLAHRLPPLPGVFRRHLLAEYQRNSAILDRIFWQLVSAQQEDGLEARLSAIKVPTLIIWGDKDAIIDVSCAATYAARIPDAEQLILPDVGHIPMFEAPKATALAHLSHMRQAAGG